MTDKSYAQTVTNISVKQMHASIKAKSGIYSGKKSLFTFLVLILAALSDT